MSSPRFPLAATPALVGLFSLSLSAQVFDGELVAPIDSQPGDGFGAAVAWTFAGEEALIGAPLSDVAGLDAGRVLRLTNDGQYCPGWSSCPIELLAPDAPHASAYGGATALDGDTLLVAAPGTLRMSDEGLPFAVLDSAGRGAVHVYTHDGTGWQLEAELGRLVSSEILAEEHIFGFDVALDGDLAVVGGWSLLGAPLETDGPVFVFERVGSEWFHAASLYPAAFAPPNGKFGQSVAISGETIVVGAPDHSPFDGEEDQGAAFVFERIGGVWTETAKLLSPDPGADYFLGADVAIDGDLLAVGEHGAPAGAVPGAGRVHRWRRSSGSWTHDGELTAPDPVAFERLGSRLDLEGERILVAGSPDRIVQFDGSSALTIPVPAEFSGFNGGFEAAGDLMVVQSDAPFFEPTSAIAFRFLPGIGWRHVQTLEAQTPSAIGYTFAERVTLDASSPPRLVIGAPQADGGGFASGLVELLAWGGDEWVFEEELLPPDLTSGDHFGAAVSRATFGLLVGAPGDDEAAPDAGSVCSYGASFEQRLLPPPPVAPGAAFGAVLAGHEDLLAVGEPGGLGRAHIYRRPGSDPWELEQTLLPPESATGPGFGSAVALAGGWLAVAAPEAETMSGANRGAVYLFAENGGAWTFTQKLEAPDGQDGERFGASLAFSIDYLDPSYMRLAIGAPDGASGGRAHVFDTHGSDPWEWMDVVTGRNTDPGDAFGFAVSIETYRLVVGAPEAAAGGAAYQFSPCGDGWVQVQELRAPNAQPGDRFGESVLYAADILVGAPGRTELLPDTGAAYAFDTTGVAASGGLTADVTLLSWIFNTPAHLALCAGLEHADKIYWILGSLSGTTPGFDALGAHIPLNPDSLLFLMASQPNQPPIVESLGQLNDHGAANATFQLPAPMFGPPFTGIDLAYLVFDPVTQAVDLVSVTERVVLN